MFEKILAAVVLLICVALLLRMVLKPAHQYRLDSVARRGFHASRRWIVNLYRWPASRRRAARVANEAIRRAREHSQDDCNWEGNVYKPKSFRRPRKPH